MSRMTAWQRWQRAAGPWRGWAVCPSLTVPRAPITSAPANRPPTLSRDLENVFNVAGTAMVLDLEPVVGVEISAAISLKGLAYVVLVLPRWPHEDAVLPCKDLTETLVQTSTFLGPTSERVNVVFVLDAERRRSMWRASNDRRIDNRYDLATGDLPNLTTLREAGIRRIVKVTRR